jgi:hypothetical protein
LETSGVLWKERKVEVVAIFGKAEEATRVIGEDLMAEAANLFDN